MRIKLLFVITTLGLSFTANGQTNCNFQPDTVQIFYNNNLDGFISKLEKEKFIIFNDKKNIPSFILDELNCLTKNFTIANPTEQYNCCCTRDPRTPDRKLLFLAKSNNVLVITYLTGGIAVCTHILLIEFKNDKITDLWNKQCFPELKSKKALINYLKQYRSKKTTWGFDEYM